MAYYGGDRPLGSDPETLPDNPCKNCWENKATSSGELCHPCEALFSETENPDEPNAKY